MAHRVSIFLIRLMTALLFAGASSWVFAKNTHYNAPARQNEAKAVKSGNVGKNRKTPAMGIKAQKASFKPSKAWDGDPMKLGSASVLVMDQHNGRVLLQKNPEALLPIASISKLMTAMVVLDARQDMDEVITVTEEDIDSFKGTRSRLSVGTALTRDAALLLALMSSENRAAHALSRHYPGGLSAFVAAMNRKAREMGLHKTRFEEPTGLSVNNVSTPGDLARMTAAAYQYPKIREYSTMEQAYLDTGDHVLKFRNTNTLVKNAQWRIGLSKTGYINEAGRCLVMQAWIADRPVVIVLLDSTGRFTREGDANRIKSWMEKNRLPQNTGA